MTTLKTPYKSKVFRCKPEDFSSQLDVVGSYLSYKGRYLFLHRSPKSSQGLTWGVPAGKLEDGESPLTGALRELKEETGIELEGQQLRSLGPLYIRYPHLDFVYHLFAYELSSLMDIKLSDEHIDYRWLSEDDFSSLPLISGGQETFNHFSLLQYRYLLKERKFYFIRHGETDGNRQIPKQAIDADWPLNETGMLQVSQLRQLVSQLPIRQVYLSPLLRAQQTTELLEEELPRRRMTEERLRECSLDIWKDIVRLSRGKDPFSWQSLQSFFACVADGIAAALENEESTLLVAHGGVYWAICYLLAIEETSWFLGNGELVEFNFSAEAWTATRLNILDNIRN